MWDRFFAFWWVGSSRPESAGNYTTILLYVGHMINKIPLLALMISGDNVRTLVHVHTATPKLCARLVCHSITRATVYRYLEATGTRCWMT